MENTFLSPLISEFTHDVLKKALLYAVLRKARNVTELRKYVQEYLRLTVSSNWVVSKEEIETAFFELWDEQYLAKDNGSYYLTRKGKELLYSTIASLPL